MSRGEQNRARTAGSLFAFEKHQQLIHRHAPSFIRDVLDTFRQCKLTAAQATDQLGISPSRLYAPTPQAKGKVEREHQFRQSRLPPYFASEKITEIGVANPHIDALRAHHNTQEVHRELGQTPPTRLESGPEGKSLRSPSDPALPLVELCVERAHHP